MKTEKKKKKIKKTFEMEQKKVKINSDFFIFLNNITGISLWNNLLWLKFDK